MKLPRRQFLHLAAGAAALPLAFARNARAQTYPSRPVRLLVGFPPGGPADILARLLGQWLSDRLGQPFIIESRPGASGNIATEAVVRSPADGHTLLLVVPGNAISDLMYDKLNFSFTRDAAPVAGISNGPLIMEVNPALPVHTVPEFIAYAKARPGQINFGSPGIGTTIHLCGELFNMLTGVTMVHVPYRGNAPAMTDLMAGQVQLMFADAPSSIGHVKAGKLRALAVTTASARGHPARGADRQRFPAGLRGQQLVRDRRAEEHTARHRQQAERRDQPCACRRDDQGAARRFRCGAADRLARRFRKIHGRRSRQVGQGDPDRRNQA